MNVSLLLKCIMDEDSLRHRQLGGPKKEAEQQAAAGGIVES